MKFNKISIVITAMALATSIEASEAKASEVTEKTETTNAVEVTEQTKVTDATKNQWYAVETNSFFSNWFVQVGLDMTLQNPYGYDFFGGVFPNGKSFGMDIALGKWFTPEFGLRGKFNWENTLPLLKNDHANWLAPFYEPGVNRDNGGYIVASGDFLLDVHNLFKGYLEDRVWNLQVFPRMGVAYNFGVSKGTPLLGLGIGNTFKLSDRTKLYFDVAYSMVSSGFSGMGTGVGSNSNGFFDFNAGVQIDLGKNHTFHRADQQSNISSSQKSSTQTTYDPMKSWYVQYSLDMSLMNPYGYNFSKVFPKGKTFGMAIGLGKRFSPQVSLRGRIKWENGFKPFENKHLEWMSDPWGPENTNMEDGGYIEATIDVPLYVTQIFMGSDVKRNWDVIAYPRMGIVSNLSTKSASPAIGIGAGYSYRLDSRWSIFTDAAYMMTTSEFFGGDSSTGMGVSTGNNGFLDFHIGIQYDL